MLIQIFSNKNGDVIVPTIVQTEAGYWMGVEPVECASWRDPQSVMSAVRNAAARSGQIVPTPSRQNFPKEVILSYGKAKSMSQFERKFKLTSVFQSSDGRFSIERYRTAPEGTGGLTDADTSATYPPGTSLEEVVASLAAEFG